eukprot:CAMPEP_0196570834 /NCGR_PEP_ID=MMETSP1081-20130531/1022_1 /TAXON_ID=36882 /ORGANISM="Pyramimonas amylifera, Strain CCMP720" /LENGTH=215 /DNA_ID=CAMNT_0041887513 /DNA_START=52 /DNA_END=699 /DNA_ORIENTATION=+
MILLFALVSSTAAMTDNSYLSSDGRLGQFITKLSSKNLGIHFTDSKKCEHHRNEKFCLGVDGCSWCEHDKYPNACMDPRTVKMLPPQHGFQCHTAETKRYSTFPFPDACMKITEQEKCSTNSTCTWCKSAAIPSECLSKELAKYLPSSVFECDTEVLPFQKCLEHAQDHYECSADKPNKCVYCKSQVPLVPSYCATEDDPTRDLLQNHATLWDCN